MIVSPLLVIFGSSRDNSKPSNFKKLLSAINFIRGAVAVVYQLLDLAEHKSIMPSAGVSTVFLGLLGSSQAFSTIYPPIIYGGVVIFAIGTVPYLVNGLFASITPDPGAMSIELIVDIGCSGGYFTDVHGLCSAIEPNQIIYKKTIGDWFYQIGWAGAVLICILIAVSSISKCMHASELVYLSYITTRYDFLILGAFTGGMVMVGGCLGTGDYSTSVIDCSQATHLSGYYSGCDSAPISLQGSSSGFWNISVENEAAIARSIFTW
jgi:hypothetical protein